MANWQEIIKKRFGELEKQIDIGDGLYVTIKKIDALRKKELTSMEGQLLTSTTDPNNPGRQILIQQFTKEYDEKIKDQWKLLFLYGVDPVKHNLETNGTKEILDLKFWECMSKEWPELFSEIELKIKEFNGFGIEAADTKKK